MAYAPYNSTSPNPPFMAIQPMAFGGGSTFNSTISSSLIGGRVWFACSTHLQTDIGSSDFISDGLALGMKKHDMLIHVSLSSAISFHRCSTVGSTYASFSPGLVISSAS